MSRALVLMLAIASCVPGGSLAASVGTSAGPPRAAAQPANSSSELAEPTEFPGSIIRRQIMPLEHRSIADAKAGLAKLGFRGEVEIAESFHFIEGCALDTVCSIEPESGFALDATISFVINKKIAVAAPPP